MNDPTRPQVQLWSWPAQLEPGRITRQPATPATPVRIGDAERDRAVSTLGDHFAAGRLTREEFDERSDQAMAARFDADLRPLFADLPRTQPVPATTGPAPVPVPVRTVGPLMMSLWFLTPFLLVGAVVAAVALGAPWLLWMFFWVAVMASMTGRRPHGRPGFHSR